MVANGATKDDTNTLPVIESAGGLGWVSGRAPEADVDPDDHDQPCSFLSVRAAGPAVGPGFPSARVFSRSRLSWSLVARRE